MSDLGEATTPVQTDEDENKVIAPPDTVPARAGESFFQAQAQEAGALGDFKRTGDATKLDAIRDADHYHAVFMEDQKAAAGENLARQMVRDAAESSTPKVSGTMQDNATELRRIQTENPDQWKAVQAEIATAQATPRPDAPTITLQPSWLDRRIAGAQNLLARLGFGKKQEPLRQ